MEEACNLAKLRGDNSIRLEDLQYSAGIISIYLLFIESQFNIRVPIDTKADSRK